MKFKIGDKVILTRFVGGTTGLNDFSDEIGLEYTVIDSWPLDENDNISVALNTEVVDSKGITSMYNENELVLANSITKLIYGRKNE